MKLDDDEDTSYKVTIPAHVQTQRMPNNVPISVIFSVQWSSGAKGISYMNIVYEVTLVVKVDIVYQYCQYDSADSSSKKCCTPVPAPKYDEDGVLIDQIEVGVNYCNQNITIDLQGDYDELEVQVNLSEFA